MAKWAEANTPRPIGCAQQEIVASTALDSFRILQCQVERLEPVETERFRSDLEFGSDQAAEAPRTEGTRCSRDHRAIFERRVMMSQIANEANTMLGVQVAKDALSQSCRATISIAAARA